MNVAVPARLTDAEAEAIYRCLYPNASQHSLGDLERNAVRETCRRLRETLSAPRKVPVRARIECSPGGYRLQHLSREDGGRLDHVGTIELVGTVEEPWS